MVFGGRRFVAAMALVIAGLVVLAAAIYGAVGATELISVSSTGAQTDGYSYCSAISADGRHVAFDSYASTLAPTDTNGYRNVFVRDRVLSSTELVSVALDGNPGNGHSYDPSISADGRYVAFDSAASNLTPGDTCCYDVFVRDRLLGATERVSVSLTGTQADNSSFRASISADGRYVAFHSNASNLVTGDTYLSTDVFVRDRVLSLTERVSVSVTGAQANGTSVLPAISADGRYVAFYSEASNLVPSDTNYSSDIFVRDRVLSSTERVSVSVTGIQANDYSYNPRISADGRYVAFDSTASNLVPSDTNGASDVFVRDRVAGATERVSVASSGAQAGLPSDDASISADGRYVAFDSTASNLTPGDTNAKTDIFVRDRVAGATERVSLAADGAQANDGSFTPRISADGRHIAFQSFATNLVPSDTNGYPDVFVRDQAEAVGGAVAGAVGLQGRANPPRADGAIVAVGAYTTTTSASGAFTVTGIAAGTYTVTATMPGYLYAQRSGVAVSEGVTTTLPTVTLLGGDADRDNDNDIYDLTLLGASFGATGPLAADINGDGVVNVFDLAVVGANFGRSAPLVWQ